MENLIFLLPIVVGVAVGLLFPDKSGSYRSGDSSDSLDDLNTRDRLKYGFIIVDNMKQDTKERAERVRRREEKE